LIAHITDQLLISSNISRLPIIQGGTFSFFVPTFAILSLQKFQCPDGFDKNTNTWTDPSMTYENKTEEWQFRMREIQGAICVSAIFQVVMGFTGNQSNKLENHPHFLLN